MSRRDRGRFDRQSLPSLALRGSARRLRAERLEDRRMLATLTVTSLLDSGAGSLREAINLANADSTPDEIVFDSAVFSTPQAINLDSQLPTISQPLAIIGPGADLLTIDARGGSRHLLISDSNSQLSTDVALSGVTLTGGDALDGGAILNFENLSITESTISGNSADDRGGGVYNGSNGNLTITNSTISGNLAQRGGGIHNVNSLAITNSTLSENSALVSDGGGINNFSGLLTITNSTITNSTISRNSANRNGGGINNNGGTLTITSSTISGNSTMNDIVGLIGDGGGINNDLGTLTITNSTVSGNSALAGSGGGISSSLGTLNVHSSTIAGNSDLVNENGESGGGIHLSPFAVGPATLVGSIVANSPFGDLSGFGPLVGSHNLIQDGQNLDGLTNTVTGDPFLGTLTDNGGPTFTHGLFEGSPAIDAGLSDAEFDQRGAPFPRDFGAGVDIGAFELSPSNLPPITVRAEGAVFSDNEGNGVFDHEDVALGSVAVFADLNLNSMLDAGEPLVMTSDDPAMQGQYSLTFETDRNQAQIVVVSPNGFALGNPASGVFNLVVTPGIPDQTGLDFALAPSTPTGPAVGDLPGRVSGTVFNDISLDGVRQEENEPGAPGLVVFADVDENGVFDDAIDRFTVTNAAGAYDLSGVAPGEVDIRVVAEAPFGQTYPLDGGANTLLLDSDGVVREVDFGVRNFASFDYGDLAGFPTLEAEDGARHVVTPGSFLGFAIDADLDGQPNALATGDDTDTLFNDVNDDDGVLLQFNDTNSNGLISAGESLSFQILVNGAGQSINAWIDFDGDGVWQADEQVFTDELVAPGLNFTGAADVQFDLPEIVAPADTVDGPLAARFRLGSAGLSFAGPADSGEVEDYLYNSAAPPPPMPVNTLPGDYNFDGVVSTTDYQVWQISFGLTGTSTADGNGDSLVDAADYNVWRDNLGASFGAAGITLLADTDDRRAMSSRAFGYRVPVDDFGQQFTLPSPGAAIQHEARLATTRSQALQHEPTIAPVEPIDAVFALFTIPTIPEEATASVRANQVSPSQAPVDQLLLFALVQAEEPVKREPGASLLGEPDEQADEEEAAAVVPLSLE